MEIVIRQLKGADAAAYHLVRVRALREHPTAFSSTAAAWAAFSPDEVAQRLAQPSTTSAIFGAFADDGLVGIAGFYRPDANPKLRHRADLVGMYVAATHRQRGIGRRLVDAVIAHARRQSGLEELLLGVTTGNDDAQRLYGAAGFQPFFVEPRHLKLDGRYYDMQMMVLLLKQDNEG